MRSYLFVPADSERKLAKSRSFDADCLFLDLEDAVELSQKPRAREIAKSFIAAAKTESPRPLLYVRVNALDTGLIDADLDGIMPAGPDGIVLPKCSGGADVQHLGAKLAVHEALFNLVDGSTKIISISTENAASIFGLSTYAGASQRLAGLAWGPEDLSADLGAEANRFPDGSLTPPFALTRNLALVAAVAARVQPIDAAYPNFRDLAGLRRECEASRRDGFSAMMAIHPDQVAVINEVFTPSPAAIAHAQAIVDAFAADPQAGVKSINGEMLDRPHLIRAERLLARLQPR